MTPTSGGQEHYPLSALASQMGDLIAAYDALPQALPEASGHAALRLLMTEHPLIQSD